MDCQCAECRPFKLGFSRLKGFKVTFIIHVSINVELHWGSCGIMWHHWIHTYVHDLIWPDMTSHLRALISITWWGSRTVPVLALNTSFVPMAADVLWSYSKHPAVLPQQHCSCHHLGCGMQSNIQEIFLCQKRLHSCPYPLAWWVC